MTITLTWTEIIIPAGLGDDVIQCVRYRASGVYCCIPSRYKHVAKASIQEQESGHALWSCPLVNIHEDNTDNLSIRAVHVDVGSSQPRDGEPIGWSGRPITSPRDTSRAGDLQVMSSNGKGSGNDTHAARVEGCLFLRFKLPPSPHSVLVCFI